MDLGGPVQNRSGFSRFHLGDVLQVGPNQHEAISDISSTVGNADDLEYRNLQSSINVQSPADVFSGVHMDDYSITPAEILVRRSGRRRRPPER